MYLSALHHPLSGDGTLRIPTLNYLNTYIQRAKVRVNSEYTDMFVDQQMSVSGLP